MIAGSDSRVETSNFLRVGVAFTLGLAVWLVCFFFLQLRPDLLLRGSYFLFSDGGQYLWVVDQLDRGKQLYTEIHWYYGVIPLWAYRAWAAALGNSAETFTLYSLSGMAFNAGLACWWLSRLVPLRWSVAGVLLTIAPWLVRNSVSNIHVPWEITALLALACVWQPLEVRGRGRQALLGALLTIMAMIKLPLLLAGGFALFATDVYWSFGPGAQRCTLRGFASRYWPSVLTSVVGFALYLGWLWWMIGDVGIWLDTAFPLYMTQAYATIGDPPPWHWEGWPFLLFNQVPILLAFAASLGMVGLAVRHPSHRALPWLAKGGLLLPLGLLFGPLSVIRHAAHVFQYYWMGLLAVAVCLPLLHRQARIALVALLVLIAAVVPYKMMLQPKVATLRSLGNGQSLWLTEAEWEQWQAITNGWIANRKPGRMSALVFEIGAGAYFYAGIPLNFRQYYYYPGFIRPYDVDWLATHQDEFCGVLVTGNSTRMQQVASDPTPQRWLHLDQPENRIKIGVPQRVGERCLFLPFVDQGTTVVR